MGCGGSKLDDSELVVLCRERRDFIRAAVDNRYALASAHLSYFRSLKDVGEALSRFVDEELVIGSPPSSPVLTLPSDEGKRKRRKNKGIGDNNNNNTSSSTTSLSHSDSFSHHHSPEEDSHLHLSEDSHLHLSSSHGSDSGSLEHRAEDTPERPAPSSFSPPTDSTPTEANTYSYFANYMKRSSTAIPSVYYQEPHVSPAATYWPDPSYPSYSGYPQYETGGFYGFSMGSPSGDPYSNRPQTPPAAPPEPPPPPEVSPWDFLNPFDSLDSGYPRYHYRGYGSSASSPDSMEVRKREGIPDLEDDTEQESLKGGRKGKQLEEDIMEDSGEGTSKAVPSQYNESTSSGQEKEIKSSPETLASKSVEKEDSARKKGVSFEVEAGSAQDVESSKLSSLTTIVSTHGTRDLQEVVKEIRDEFVTASDYGKEVSVMLEVGKLRYQPKGAILKVISSRILDLISFPVMAFSQPPSRQQRQAVPDILRMSRANNGDTECISIQSGSLSSTLEKLYAWEKKLYKEVKDEERLRVIYEKKCKRLKVLDAIGAEPNKIDATQASIRKLVAKIDVTIRSVDAISGRIHKLRDEELQPQLTELIHGLIRTCMSLLKCHQKQFQAIIESKSHTLMANTGVRRDSSLRATLELELQLLNWSSCFHTWINTQKAYVESLNEWLKRCLHQEQEETPDGLVPFSPGRAGAPLAFVICNDWCDTILEISEKNLETGVEDKMHAFASSLRQLWEKQDEEQRQRLKAAYLSKDFDKRLRSLRKEESKKKWDQDALSDKTLSAANTESGVSALDDLKVDLDSMRKRLEEERARHEETVKQVHAAASNSLQSGLIPIFKALEKFTSMSIDAYKRVRIENAGGGT
ncbi:PREDICTED: uncharacterized protein LOC104587543 [Nelumbo nucifera]|uniref:Uncharacterized protein LOC104587543 n=2 Tax=Nelumbo nucifera TaxID=4432 RepID=A0A1U7YT65_NELNU|nr:PREDICTED: uncharacterized protein LOC104587543 [Nelumbo nucifera]XP_010243494.1 PREDICTED: uncharacterized protein LOC104587543 [Nelumbo nucifera]XP_019051583.1 PREDICTED: uncharacterized protein LOC104587543 [Nelumbo nucifera]DAD39728.1 TPA_asm: hypothetical protein HUJ06_014051 [Nelumbo nucifera]